MRKLYRCLPAVILCLWSFQTFAQCLNGIYKVGPGQTYTTLTAAITDYNTKCLAGPVVFELTASSYGTGETFPIQINANTDASSTKTLTIRPATGVTTTIISSSSAIIKLNGADYVTIDGSNNGSTSKDLTIQNTRDDALPGSCAGIWIGSLGAGAGATHNTIKNCVVRMNGRGFGDIEGQSGNINYRTFYAIFAGSATDLPIENGFTGGGKGADNDQLTIQNNLVLRASHGIYVAGQTTGLDDGLVVSNNTIGDAVSDTNSISLTAIHLFHCTGAAINGNVILNVNSIRNSDCTGMILDTGFVSSTVSNNKIIRVKQYPDPLGNGSGGCGIDIRTTIAASNLTISNNMISGMEGEGSTNFNKRSIIGIRVTGLAGGIKFYFNSVFLNLGTFIGWAGQSTSAALYIGAQSTGIEIKNNIFANNLFCTWGGVSYAVLSLAPASAFTAMDYNDYYVEGAQGVLARLGTTACTTLAAIQTNFGGNQHSINVKPTFVALNDLHLQVSANTALDNMGTPITGISTDIDGDSRNATTPDMGADEFSTATCTLPTITTQPTAQTVCTSGSASFSVTATGTGLSYQWRKGNIAISGANSSTYTIAAATIVDVATYDVLVTNSCGTVTSAAVQLTVNSAPATPVITAGGPLSFCSGGSVTLSSSVATRNQWYRDGAIITGATGQTYSTGVGGSYTVRDTVNNCLSAFSAAKVVTVTTIPTPTITAVAGVLNSSASTGNQWYKDGVAIAGATQASYTTTAPGSYTVQVTVNGCSSAMSAAVAVVVTAVSQIPGSSDFTAGPNPVSDRLTIKYNGNNGLFTCVLYDISGKKLKEYGPFASTLEIDMKGYSSGIYILHIIDTRKNREERRMIVRK